jgi:hypothetical protein
MRTSILANCLRFFALITVIALLLAAPKRSEAQSYPPAWSATATYAVGDTVQLNGNWYRAIKAVSTPNLTPTTYFDYWELSFVRSNTTLFIGEKEPFSTLLEAWDNVLEARIADGVYLHLYISSHVHNFSQTFTTPLSLDHGSGARISIIGDNKANDSLTFTGCNGLTLDSGHAFGMISGLTLIGQPNNGGPYIGISTTNGATIADVVSTTISGFAWCCYSANNASLTVDGDLAMQSFTIGLFAEELGSIVVTETTTQLTINGGGSTGIYANKGGLVEAPHTVLNNLSMGAQAENGALIDINVPFISGCSTGCRADLGGRVYAEYSTLDDTFIHQTSNGTDFVAKTGGIVDGLNYEVGTPTTSVDSGNGSYVYG